MDNQTHFKQQLSPILLAKLGNQLRLASNDIAEQPLSEDMQRVLQKLAQLTAKD